MKQELLLMQVYDEDDRNRAQGDIVAKSHESQEGCSDLRITDAD